MVVFPAKNMNATFGGSDIPDVLDWSFDKGGGTVEYNSSDTGGGTGRVDGNDDATASVTVAQGSAAAITATITKGTTGVLALYENGTLFHSLPVICTGYKVNVDASSNDPVSYTLEFGWAAQTGSITTPTP